MNLAKQLEEADATTASSHHLLVETESQPSNIIALPEQEFAAPSSDIHGLTDVFVDHQFSALNEW